MKMWNSLFSDFGLPSLFARPTTPLQLPVTVVRKKKPEAERLSGHLVGHSVDGQSGRHASWHDAVHPQRLRLQAVRSRRLKAEDRRINRSEMTTRTINSLTKQKFLRKKRPPRTFTLDQRNYFTVKVPWCSLLSDDYFSSFSEAALHN